MKHVKRFLALSLAAALLAGCVSCGNSDEKTSPTGGGSGVTVPATAALCGLR